MIQMNVLEERLSGIEGLPTLPMVLQQIQKVMNNPHSSMGQIAAVVAKDQALASRAIRLVNSAFYARATPVSSIQQAIVTLGLKTLNNLMIGLSVMKMFDSSRVHGYDPQAFWEHSFATALLAKKIATINGYSGDREECFVAGLLHDMGRLVLEQYLHKEFVGALILMNDNTMPLLNAEVEMMGFNHADAGAWLGKRWNIPRQLVYAMEFHHSPETVQTMDLPPTDKELVRYVTAANELSSLGKVGSSGEPVPNTRVLSAMSKVPADTQRQLLAETRSELSTTLNEWRKV